MKNYSTRVTKYNAEHAPRHCDECGKRLSTNGRYSSMVAHVDHKLKQIAASRFILCKRCWKSEPVEGSNIHKKASDAFLETMECAGGVQ